jgi:hypothetical protein
MICSRCASASSAWWTGKIGTNLLPGMALAKLAVDADLAANRLAGHLACLLAAAGGQVGGGGSRE